MESQIEAVGDFANGRSKTRCYHVLQDVPRAITQDRHHLTDATGILTQRPITADQGVCVGRGFRQAPQEGKEGQT
jgi:hypothetical protein